MTIPVGRVSETVSWDTALEFRELSTVSTRVLRPPKRTVLGLKALSRPGRSVATVRSAVATPLLPAAEVRSPEVLV
jgi:hypothetical protein